MRFSCTKENLSQALALVSGVTGKNINLPILGNVLIKAEGQKIDFVATNLEIAVVASLRGKVEEAGTFTVPARTLADFVNLLPNEKIDLALHDTELGVTCGKSATKIKGISAEDFPVIPSIEEGSGYVVEADVLSVALSHVLPAVAKNDIRPELAGVLFNFNSGESGLTLATTDSYRLAEKKVALQQGGEERRVVVPARTAQEINHALATLEAGDGEKGVRLLVSENQITVRYGNVEIVSRLVEGNYPDYTQIIPKSFVSTAVVSKTQLTKEMKAAGLFTTNGVNAVTVELNPESGVVGIASTSTQTGEYASEIEGQVAGGKNVILLNNRYVLDGLNVMEGDGCEVQVVNADSPCVFTSKDDPKFLYIVMPIRQ